MRIFLFIAVVLGLLLPGIPFAQQAGVGPIIPSGVSSGGSISAGAGLTLSGGVISLNTDNLSTFINSGGSLSAGIPVNSTTISGNTSITSGNWTTYAGKLTKVQCPAAGCTITLPQSTTSVFPQPYSGGVFWSLGPGLMTLAATTSTLEGVPLVSSQYTARQNIETDFFVADTNNNYLVSPSVAVNPSCLTPLTLPSAGNLISQPLNGSVSSWTALRTTLTASSQWGGDCLLSAATEVEDGTTNSHLIEFVATASITVQAYTEEVLCASPTGDRSCDVEMWNSAASARAYVVYGPNCTVVTSANVSSFTSVSSTCRQRTLPSGPAALITLTATPPATDTAMQFRLYMNTGTATTNQQSYAGNSASALTAWGAALCTGSSPCY